MADAERIQLLRGNDSMVGKAANLKSGREKQIDAAIDAADTTTKPTIPASPPTKSASGVDFFKGKPATASQKAAKQKALIEKMRQRGDFQESEMD